MRLGTTAISKLMVGTSPVQRMMLGTQELWSAMDPDAADYIARIVSAGSSMSAGNQAAVDAFVRGLKSDGIWSAIKASCILCAADTLAGALVPLVGPAPTNFGFVAGDYNRATGLGSNGTQAINSNYVIPAADRDNASGGVWRTTPENLSTVALLGNSNASDHFQITRVVNNRIYRANDGSGSVAAVNVAGYVGMSRAAAGVRTYRDNGTNSTTGSGGSALPSGNPVWIFARLNTSRMSGRISFYHLGQALDLALLDARIATLMASLS